MLRNHLVLSLITIALLLCSPVAADTVDDIFNYKAYDDRFASAGQPTEDQLKAAHAAGFERVIYLAFSDQERSLPNEDRVVAELGMDYLHIPIIWNKPKASHFAMFAAAMNASDEKTLLHCQANYRASAFAFLYRVIHQGVPVAQAKADMNAVWTPLEQWNDFILGTLEAHDIDPNCEGCDWTPWVPEQSDD